MTTWPGDLTPEERQEQFERLHRAATERWGVERAEAIEPSLRRLSLAIGRLGRLSFSTNDAPGFYLHQPETSHGAGNGS